MKVKCDGSSPDETVVENTGENATCYEKKVTNENQLDEKIDKSKMMKKSDTQVYCVKNGEVHDNSVKNGEARDTHVSNGGVGDIHLNDDNGSCSEDESNINTDSSSKSHCQKTEDDNEVSQLNTQIMKLKVSSGKANNCVNEVIADLSSLSVNDEGDGDGRKSPQLLPRGPNGGRATHYNHMMYGQQDWSATQASSRQKAMSGKRGYEDEINPYKFTKNAEPVEHGDYTDMSYMQQSMPQVMGSQAMSQPLMSHGLAAQSFPRPMPQAYSQNLNNLNQSQITSYQDMNRNVMSGGTMMVGPADPILQQPSLYNQEQTVSDWDPEALLALLQDSTESFPQKFDQFPQDIPNYQTNQPQYHSDEQIMQHQMNGLQKTMRNLSGDEGYDSPMSTMSPYSDSVMSPESQPSPPSFGHTHVSQYRPQMASPASNIGSPLSVDSALGGGSPASYRDQGSPASQMSVMSPAHAIPTESPMPSPGNNLTLPCTEGQAQDSIISELNKPIPQSPVDLNVPAEQYINENLGQLKDVYDVIAKDLKNQQSRKTETQPKNNSSPVSKPILNKASMNVPAKVPLPDQAKPMPGKAASIAVTAPIQTLPAATSTMTPLILKPVTTAPMQGNSIQQPQIFQVAQGGCNKMPVVGQPIAGQSIPGQNIVWVPLNPAPPIIVVRQTTPAGQKKGGPTKPRPILPKMPTILPGSSKTNTSVTSSSNKTGAAANLSAKTQVVNSAPTVVSALTSSPASRPGNKLGSSQNPMSGSNSNRMMMPGQFQQQQQRCQQPQPQQNIPRPIKGQISSGMGVPQSLNPAMDGCAPNKLNLARRYIAEMKKEDLHFQDQDGDTYLHVAICRTDPYLVKAILERLVREQLIKELIDRPNNKRQTPLYVAVADNQPLMVRELVQCGADPNCLAECQWNNGMRKEVKAAIHCAAQGGHLFTATMAELLKAKDIALNLANSEGLTAVHCAIQEHGKGRGGQVINSIPTVDMLIRAGADPNVQDKKSGKTPLMYAIETKDYNLVLSMVNLIDKDKLRNMLKTQTFDGSNCSKICSGLRMDSDIDGWRKINSLILSVSNGSDPRLYDNIPMLTS